MNIKEALLFAYGLIFATSTPYLKPKNRFLFPTATWKFDSDLTLFLGGSGICAHLRGPSGDSLLVNTNLAAAAEQWRADLAAVSGQSGGQSVDAQAAIAGTLTIAMSSLNGAFGSLETVGAFKPKKVLAHIDDIELLSAWATLPIENVSAETVVTIGDETVRLIPVNGGPTESDLVIVFEKRSVMMFGTLFSNRIHPVLKHGVALRVPAWISTLETLLTRFEPKVCVPAEGDVGDIDDVREFIRYLKSLTDQSVEFSYCRKNFDWMEIPSATSLEENFDILRRNVKTHTSLR